MYFFFPIMLLGEGAVGLSSINSRCLRGFIQIYLCQWIYWEKGIGKQKLCFHCFLHLTCPSNLCLSYCRVLLLFC
jgi:hypothetical protein